METATNIYAHLRRQMLMRWQKPSIQRWNCAKGWETRRIPPELHAKVSSELTKEGSRLRAGTCTCDEGLSGGPVESGVARSKSKWLQ